MESIVNQFPKPGELLVDLFSGALVTTKTCSELSRYHLFVGCVVDAECFAAGAEEQVEMYGGQVLN